MLVRVLYAWDGNQKPYAPNTIMEMDDDVARERMQAGHVEAIGKSEARRIYGWRPGVAQEPEAEDEATTTEESSEADEGAQVETGPSTGSGRAEGADGDGDAVAADTPLGDLTRAELNALATQLGLEQPERLANRGEVIAAIEEVRSPSEPAEE